MTKPQGSTSEWIVHPRVEHDWPDGAAVYYRERRLVSRYITAQWMAMGLTSVERSVLLSLISEAPAAFPWKYTLRGITEYTSLLFPVASAEQFRKAISGLRRKGFLNAGKVEEEGVGPYRNKVVQHPVLEVTPRLVDFCLGRELEEGWSEPFKEGPPLMGNLKTRVVKRKKVATPSNPVALANAIFIYAPELQQYLKEPPKHYPWNIESDYE